MDYGIILVCKICLTKVAVGENYDYGYDNQCETCRSRLTLANVTRIGTVISNKMSKSIVVRIDRITKHPIYRRVIKKSVKIMAHDEEEKAAMGDRVRIQETRPLSKNKRWRLVEILK